MPTAAHIWQRRFGRITADLQASILMIAAFVVFSAMAVFMRMIADRITVPQVIFVRQVMAMVLMAPLFWSSRHVILHPTGLGLHLARGVLAMGAMFCGLTAIIYIPLADATAIGMAAFSVKLRPRLYSKILSTQNVVERQYTQNSRALRAVSTGPAMAC